ncbi:MAG: hypothetical protein IKZ97_07255 [Butyrivibrio sp.]|nr:hypothetical protein [Butyrivibrio sp.]
MKKVQTNCPNCGAVMTSDSCSFCGTILYDFACLDADEPFFIKIKRRNKIYRLKVCLTEVQFEAGYDSPIPYCDDIPIMQMRRPTISTLGLNFTVLPYKAYDQEILLMGIDTDEIDPDERPY